MKKLKPLKKKELVKIQSKIIALMLQSGKETEYINTKGDIVVWKKDSYLQYDTCDLFFGKSALIKFADSKKIYCISENEDGESNLFISTSKYYKSSDAEIYKEPEEEIIRSEIQDGIDAYATLNKLKINQ